MTDPANPSADYATQRQSEHTDALFGGGLPATSGGAGYVVKVAIAAAGAITAGVLVGLLLFAWVTEHPTSWGAGFLAGAVVAGLWVHVRRRSARGPARRD